MNEEVISIAEIERRACLAAERKGDAVCPFQPHLEAAAAWCIAYQARVDELAGEVA